MQQPTAFRPTTSLGVSRPVYSEMANRKRPFQPYNQQASPWTSYASPTHKARRPNNLVLNPRSELLSDEPNAVTFDLDLRLRDRLMSFLSVAASVLIGVKGVAEEDQVELFQNCNNLNAMLSNLPFHVSEEPENVVQPLSYENFRVASRGNSPLTGLNPTEPLLSTIDRPDSPVPFYHQPHRPSAFAYQSDPPLVGFFDQPKPPLVELNKNTTDQPDSRTQTVKSSVLNPVKQGGSPKTPLAPHYYPSEPAFPGYSFRPIVPKTLSREPYEIRLAQSVHPSKAVWEGNVDMSVFFKSKLESTSEIAKLRDKHGREFSFWIRAIPVYVENSGLTEPKQVDLVIERAKSSSQPVQPPCDAEINLRVLKPSNPDESHIERLPILYTFHDDVDGRDENKLVFRRFVKHNPAIYFSDFDQKRRWLRFRAEVILV